MIQRRQLVLAMALLLPAVASGYDIAVTIDDLPWAGASPPGG